MDEIDEIDGMDEMDEMDDFEGIGGEDKTNDDELVVVWVEDDCEMDEMDEVV